MLLHVITTLYDHLNYDLCTWDAGVTANSILPGYLLQF